MLKIKTLMSILQQGLKLQHETQWHGHRRDIAEFPVLYNEK